MELLAPQCAPDAHADDRPVQRIAQAADQVPSVGGLDSGQQRCPDPLDVGACAVGGDDADIAPTGDAPPDGGHISVG